MNTTDADIAGKQIGLVGQRFGRLIVLRKTSVRLFGNVGWMCRCDCGKERIVAVNCLKTGHTKSCGCLHTSNDLTGRRFSRLMVEKEVRPDIYKTQKGIQKYRRWRCVCDCGKKVIVDQNRLISGGTKSCGCINKETCASRLDGYFSKDSKQTFKERKQRRNYERWRRLCRAVRYRDRWTCTKCGTHSHNLHVHHIKSWRDYPKLRFNKGNCTTLCVPCHRKLHKEENHERIMRHV